MPDDNDTVPEDNDTVPEDDPFAMFMKNVKIEAYGTVTNPPTAEPDNEGND